MTADRASALVPSKAHRCFRPVLLDHTHIVLRLFRSDKSNRGQRYAHLSPAYRERG